jgi:hypothetical protein
MAWDIIGDIHGHADALTSLLKKLGYREHHGAWRHTERTAVFLGDFIDRGPKQLESVTIARRMVDAGSALAVLGNHELNAIAWFLPDPERPGEYLRPHFSEKYGESNRDQHKAFLVAAEGREDLHREIVDWFLSLPLWLELPALRAVHACWHPKLMDYLEPRLQPGHRLSVELMAPASREPENESEKDSPEPSIFKAVEAITKGIEIPLPPGLSFLDKDGRKRPRVRICWWNGEARTYRQAAMLSDPERERLPETPIPAHVRIGLSGDKPVFFGHYWLTSRPAPFSERAACLDYSVAKQGRLCAYSYDGEPALEAARFTSVGPFGEE